MEDSIQKQIERGLLPNPYLLRKTDVGKFLCPDFGPVIQSDAGRLVFLRDGVVSMESNEQKRFREARAEQAAHGAEA